MFQDLGEGILENALQVTIMYSHFYHSAADFVCVLVAQIAVALPKFGSVLTVKVLKRRVQGYNATLLAYGQTGSGKSYSMVGYGPNKGLVPKLCERLFQAIRENQDTRQCQVQCVWLSVGVHSASCMGAVLVIFITIF